MKKSPREVPSKDSRYMGLAFMMAAFSKDPDTQIGAIIVGERNRPLGWGFNGPPREIDDNEIDWSRPQKYGWVIHGEINAIFHSQGDLYGSTLYVTAAPCSRCILEVIASGIKRIVYYPLKPSIGSSINTSELEKVKQICKDAKINLEEFSGCIEWITDYCHILKQKGILQ